MKQRCDFTGVRTWNKPLGGASGSVVNRRLTSCGKAKGGSQVCDKVAELWPPGIQGGLVVRKAQTEFWACGGIRRIWVQGWTFKGLMEQLSRLQKDHVGYHFSCKKDWRAQCTNR